MSNGRRGKILPSKSVQGLESTQLFDKVAEEVLHQDRAVFDSLTTHERELVVRWLSDAIVDDEGKSALHDVLWEIDHHRKPVGPDEFFNDEYYFGRSCSSLHPAWKEDLNYVFGAGSPVFEWVMTGAIGIGKHATNATKIATPTGWTLHGCVEVGDEVIGSNGKPTTVTGVFPQGRTQVHRVSFGDGCSIDVGGPHLWAVDRQRICQRTGKSRRVWERQIVATDELIARDDLRIGDSYRYRIPLVEPVEYDPVDLPCPAYLMGALLGDGCLTKGSIELSGDDLEVGDHIAEILADTMPEIRLVRAHRRWTFSKGSCGGVLNSNPLMAVIRELGLAGFDSHTKFVPQLFLYAGVEDRKELLRGMLDTDGTSIGRNSTMFHSSNENLALQLIQLVQSLGGVASLSSFQRDDRNVEYAVSIAVDFCPFRIPRKVARWKPRTNQAVRRAIVSIEPAGKADCTCIQVDAKDALYVAENFIVTHNTTLACAGLGYKLYQLSCLRDPSAYYGLLPDSLVVFGVYSITKKQVNDAGYYKLRGFLDSSPYFRQEFPRSKKIDSKIDFERSMGRKVQVIPGSQELHALGLDLFSFLMDEVNFMRVKNDKEAGVQTGQAYDLYNATYTRLQSRFIRPGGTLPGMMFLLSSRNSQTSFLEEHLRKVKGQSSTHVSDYALWEVKSKKKFSLPKFPVEIGDRVAGSRLLKAGEAIRPGARVVEIPGEFRKPFLEDIDQALRDIAGVATFNLSPLIRDRQSVFDGVRKDMVHPFTADTLVIDIHDDTRIDDYFKLKTVARTDRSEWRPILNPNHPRFIHIDIGLTGDALGFAMGHVAGTTKNTRWNPDGTESSISNPYAVIDMMCRVKPPPGGEVDLAKVRSFIIYLSKIYSISLVTFDGFQSADSIQILKKSDIASRKLSVDRDDEAYLSLRSAMFDRRIAYCDYEIFIDEILDLERDMTSRKVDHPIRSTKGGKGSKDVADAVAGVVWHLMNDPNATAIASLPDFEAAAQVAEEEVRTNGTSNRRHKRAVSKPSLTKNETTSTRKVGSAKWESLRGNVQR